MKQQKESEKTQQNGNVRNKDFSKKNNLKRTKV